MKSINQWFEEFETISDLIPQWVLDYCDEMFDPDDDYYFVEAARMYYVLNGEDYNGFQ